jgi:hypothetical protein
VSESGSGPETLPSIILKPYVDAILALGPSSSPVEPLFTAYYRVPPHSPTSEEPRVEHGLRPPVAPHLPLPESPDAAAAVAEAVFNAAVKKLKPDSEEEIDFWPPQEDEGDDDDD